MDALAIARTSASTSWRERSLSVRADRTAMRRLFLPVGCTPWRGIMEVASGQSGPVEKRAILIGRLPTLRLRTPLAARVSYEDGEWLAEAVDLPLYGSGDNEQQAREMLAREIESLWQDLNEDAQYGEEMLLALRLLRNVIVE